MLTSAAFRSEPMTVTRTAFWLAEDDRIALCETIIDVTTNTFMFPAVRAELDAVLTELGVVEARDKVWPGSAHIVRVASGYDPDVLPIRMSDSETDAVLALPTLPASVRDALTRRKP